MNKKFLVKTQVQISCGSYTQQPIKLNGHLKTGKHKITSRRPSQQLLHTLLKKHNERRLKKKIIFLSSHLQKDLLGHT